MNPAHISKINWTQVLVLLATALFISGVIPKEYETVVIGLIGAVAPTATLVFRTWFTGLK